MKRSKIKQANFIKSVRIKLSIPLASLRNSILAPLFLFLAFTFSIKAQVGIGTDSPGSSSILELQSESKGFLLPKINDVSKIKSPAEGLLIYNLKEHCVSVYKNNKWNCLNINSKKPVSNPIIYTGDATKSPYTLINKVHKKENNVWTTSIGETDRPSSSSPPMTLMAVENGIIYAVFAQEIWKNNMGTWVKVTNTKFNFPTSMLVNEGVIYIVDLISGNTYNIYTINNGTSTRKYTLSDSTVIRIALEGQLLYIVEVGGKKIFQYDLSGKTTLKDVSGQNIPNLISTNDFSMEDVDNGIIYVANSTQIWKKGVSSNTWDDISGGTNAPSWSNISGIKVKEGVVYVVDKQLRQVWKKESGGWTNISGSFTFSNPMGIAVDVR